MSLESHNSTVSLVQRCSFVLQKVYQTSEYMISISLNIDLLKVNNQTNKPLCHYYTHCVLCIRLVRSIDK